MFDSLSERLTQTLRAVGGRGRLTEDNIRDSVRQVRLALLEADVAFVGRALVYRRCRAARHRQRGLDVPRCRPGVRQGSSRRSSFD